MSEEAHLGADGRIWTYRKVGDHSLAGGEDMEWTRDVEFASGSEQRQWWRIVVRRLANATEWPFVLRMWGTDEKGRNVLQKVFHRDYTSLNDAQEAAAVEEGSVGNGTIGGPWRAAE